MAHSLNPFGFAQGAEDDTTLPKEGLKQNFGNITIGEGARTFVGHVDKVQTMNNFYGPYNK